MMEMIELQVWLAQGQAVKVLARCEELLAACQRFHYGLVALYVRVQMAAAYGLYGQPAEARAALEQALAEAAPDGFWMPLAENYRYLARCWLQGGWGSAQPLVERAIALGQRYEARGAQHNGSADRPAIAAALTEKELALAGWWPSAAPTRRSPKHSTSRRERLSSTSTSCTPSWTSAGPCETSAPSWLPFLAQNTNQRLIGILPGSVVE